MLFLANITTRTVHSPGDDGMSGPHEDSFTRLVEAVDVEQAEAKVRAKYEQDKPYLIRVDVEVELSEVIR